MDKALFIFDRAERKTAAVDEWLSGEPAGLYSLARHWFEVCRDCGEDVDELLHDGCPTACINGAAFAYVKINKAHVNLGFYTGAFLPDPERLLEGSGKRMRHIKLYPDLVNNENAITELIASAYKDVTERLLP